MNFVYQKIYINNVDIIRFSIVTAFILDMFMYEYTFSKKGTMDTKVEMTIKKLQLGIDDETYVSSYTDCCAFNNKHIYMYLL